MTRQSLSSANTEKALNQINWGNLRRINPLSRRFGYDREGGPVDRYYIENFLRSKKVDIRGTVLEIKDNAYTVRFGGKNVSKSEILDINPRNRNATIVGDLTDKSIIGENKFDCIILSQVLQLVYNLDDAISNIYRILKPGGTLLLTVPGITQIAYRQLGKTWYWSFSEASVYRMLEEKFSAAKIDVRLHGNVVAATAFLYGLGARELTTAELEHTDPDYQLIIGGRAEK